MLTANTIVPALFWAGVHSGKYQMLARIQGVACEFIVGVDEPGTRIFVFRQITDGPPNLVQKWQNNFQPSFYVHLDSAESTDKLIYWRAWDEVMHYAVHMASEDLLSNTI